MATPVRTAEEKKPQMRLLIAVLIVCLLLSLLVDGRKKCKKRRKIKMSHPYYKQSFEMSPIFQIYICVRTLHESALTSQFWSVVVSEILMMPVMRRVMGSIMTSSRAWGW